MLKLADNPPITWPEDAVVSAMAGRWWVGHTKARFEKAFAWDLLGREIPYFLPMLRRTIISGGRKRRLMMPLFSSYVFFAGDESARYAALATNRLCQVITVIDQRRLIEELSAVQRVLAGSGELDPCPFAAVGRRCRVARGPFAGVEGIVIRRDRVTRLVLQVSILGQGAAMEIDTDLLEAVE